MAFRSLACMAIKLCLGICLVTVQVSLACAATPNKKKLKLEGSNHDIRAREQEPHFYISTFFYS